MKKFLFMLLYIIQGIGLAQSNFDDCVPDDQVPWNGQVGGKWLPSTGNINILVIFAEFPDDNYIIGDPL